MSLEHFIALKAEVFTEQHSRSPHPSPSPHVLSHRCVKGTLLSQRDRCSESLGTEPGAPGPQSLAAALRAALYFPLISLGSGTRLGQGTCPSTSQMHSRRQYFRGPKWAG